MRIPRSARRIWARSSKVCWRRRYVPSGDEDLNTADEPDIEWFRSGIFDSRKFGEYLLSPAHPVGRHKFRWLSSTFGFDEGDGELMERLIREQLKQAREIREKEPKPAAEDPRVAYRRWEIIIPRFRGPNGNVEPMLTAWALDPRRDKPHFTDAYRVKGFRRRSIR